MKDLGSPTQDAIHYILRFLWGPLFLWEGRPQARNTVSHYAILGGGFKKKYFHPYLGKIPILTNIFQMG